MERKLEPLSSDAASATTAVRLVTLGGPHLVTSQSLQGKFTLSLAALADGSAPGDLKTAPSTTDRLPTVATPPGPPPDWDALAHADGSTAVVWTVAGSAVSQLAYKNRKDAVALTVNRGTPFGVFGAPRFVSGGQSDSIAAIASLSDQDPSVVVFRQQPNAAFEDLKPVEASWRGIPVGAKVVQVSGGYLIFVKVVPPGGQIPNAQPRRVFGARQSYPGWLDVVRLDSDLKPVPTPAAQLQSDVVFELDAIVAGGRIALVTTTPAGATLALWDEQGHPIVEAKTSQGGSAQRRSEMHLTSTGPLTSPSLLSAKGRLYVVAIRDAGPNAQVVGASVDPSSL